MKNQNKKLVCKNCYEVNFIFEARFIFSQPREAATPTPPVQSALPEKQKAPEKGDIGSLAADIQTTVRTRMDESLGEHVDWDSLQYSVDRLIETWHRLIENFTGTPDELNAIGGAYFGYTPDQVRESVAEVVPSPIPEATKDDKDVPPEPPEEQEQEPPSAAHTKKPSPRPQKKIAWPERSRAARAFNQLREHGDYADFINYSVSVHGGSRALYGAIITMESNWNRDSQTGSAMGLAQARPDGVRSYVRKRYAQLRSDPRAIELRKKNGYGEFPDAPNLNDRTSMFQFARDPQIAFDFMGFHLQELVRQANVSVRQLKLPTSYALTLSSDPKWLYMTYNNGGKGYALLRGFLDGRIPEAKLTAFQKEIRVYKGQQKKDWEVRKDYATRTADVVAQYAQLETQSASAVA